MIYCTMNESPKGKSLEGTVGSKEKEFEIEGKLIAIDRPTVGRYVLVTVERDDSTFCAGKYDYGDADVSARMESSFRYYSGKRVKLKLGQSLNKSQDFYEGLGPVQLVKSKNEENGRLVYGFTSGIRRGLSAGSRGYKDRRKEWQKPHEILSEYNVRRY